MKTVQRERRYVCGQTKQNAVYQEIEIYTVGTDQKSRQREKQKVTTVPFRGKNPEHWDGHNMYPERYPTAYSVPVSGSRFQRGSHSGGRAANTGRLPGGLD